MKKIIFIIAAVIVLAGAGYYLMPESGQNITKTSYKTVEKAEFGIEFSYKEGENGYVLEERPGTAPGPVETFTLVPAADKVNPLPESGERPPVMEIRVFKNANKEWPEGWAEKNPEHSNINLKIGEIAGTTLGGTDAVRFKTDGLYVSDNVVASHGDNIYFISGQFMDQNSSIRADFQPFLDSIRFLPSPDQNN